MDHLQPSSSKPLQFSHLRLSPFTGPQISTLFSLCSVFHHQDHSFPLNLCLFLWYADPVVVLTMSGDEFSKLLYLRHVNSISDLVFFQLLDFKSQLSFLKPNCRVFLAVWLQIMSHFKYGILCRWAHYICMYKYFFLYIGIDCFTLICVFYRAFRHTLGPCFLLK